MASPDIPKFRYVQDVTNFVNNLAKEVDELGQVINKQQKVLAYLKTPKESIVARINRLTSSLAIFEIGEDSPAARKRRNKAMRKTIDSTLDRVVVPNLKNLKAQYGLAQDLYEKYQTLESVETSLDMQFADARDLEKAKSGITKLKKEIQVQLKKVMAFLHEVASEHVPDSFQQYMEAVKSEVQEHVFFDSSELFLYVNVSPGGAIVFTYYLMLRDAMNEDGEVAPSLYIAIQWNQGAYADSGEKAYVRVYLDHEFDLPEKLAKRSDGEDVSSVADAVKVIATLLEVENFSSSLGVIPLALQMKVSPAELSSDMFSYRDYIQKVEVNSDDQTLSFVLRKNVGADKESVAKIGQQLFLEVKKLVKKSKGTKIRMKVTTVKGQYRIDFIVTNLATDMDLNQFDTEVLREKFNLNDTQLRKIVRILSQGNRDE